MDRHELPCLLVINLAEAPMPVREALAFDAQELGSLLERAKNAAVPLAIVTGSDCVLLLSTHTGHVRAFGPVLASLRARAARTLGLGALRVKPLRGSDAARFVVQHAAGLVQESSDLLARLHGAAALASRAGTLGTELTDLIALAERVRARVRSETRLGHSGASREEAELEQLAAERVVEEEIVEWQALAPELRGAARPSELPAYGAEEAESAVRLRVARVLDKLGVA